MKKQKISNKDSRKEQKEDKPFNKDFYGKRNENPVGKNSRAKKKSEGGEDFFEYGNSDSEKDFRNSLKKEKSSLFQRPVKPLSEKKGFEKKYNSDGEDKVNAGFKSRVKTNLGDNRDKVTDRKFSNDKYERKSGASKISSNYSKSYHELDNTKTSSYHKKSIFDKEDKEKRTPSFGKPYTKKPFKKKEFNEENYKKSKLKTAPKVDDGLIRLNKFIANAGICSRREADELITAGAISVNGKIVTELGFRIKPTDMVNYGGQGLKAEKMVYLLLNKPKDYITTSDDPHDRKTVMSLVKDACKERLFSVGRLDRNTTGLLLLTNDGSLTEKITHPSYNQKKIYQVELDAALKKEHLLAIKEGIELEDGMIKVDEIEYVSGDKTNKEIGVTLHSGKNRIVRRIFEHFEYKVKKLDRVYFAGLTKKDLPRGRWRMLTTAEVNMLKMTN